MNVLPKSEEGSSSDDAKKHIWWPKG